MKCLLFNKNISFNIIKTVFFFLFLFHHSVCSAQEIPISLSLESKGGINTAGLIPDILVDASINPVFLKSQKNILYLGGRLEIDETPPDGSTFIPLNYSHLYTLIPYRSINIGVLLTEKVPYSMKSRNLFRRYRTGEILLNKSFSPSLGVGISFKVQDYSYQSNFNKNANWINALPYHNESYSGYLLYSIGISASFQLLYNLHIMPMIQIQKHQQRDQYEYSSGGQVYTSYLPGEYPGQNGLRTMYIETVTKRKEPGRNYIYPKFSIQCCWNPLSFLSSRLLISYTSLKYKYNYSNYNSYQEIQYSLPEADMQNKIYIRENITNGMYDYDKIRIGIGTSINIFHFLTGHCVLDIQKEFIEKSSDSKLNYNYSPYESLLKSDKKLTNQYINFINALESKISDNMKIIISIFLFTGDKDTFSRYELGHLNFGLEAKLLKNFYGWIFFKINKNRLGSDLYFQFVYKL
jgi:hypothetical protein